MASVLLGLAGVGMLLIALLAIPMNIGFSAALDAPDQPFRMGARLRWAFGFIDVPLQKKKPLTTRRKSPPKPQRKKQRRSRFKPSRLLANPAFWERTKRLLGRLMRAVHWHAFRLHARFGLDDPADTGRVFGAVGALAAVLVPSRADVTIDPVFEGPALTLQSEGEIRFVPLRVIGILLGFGLSPATWRVLWPAWRKR